MVPSSMFAALLFQYEDEKNYIIHEHVDTQAEDQQSDQLPVARTKLT